MQPDLCGDICSLARENVRIQASDVQMKTNGIYDDSIKVCNALVVGSRNR
jgi:exoribonuclease II